MNELTKYFSKEESNENFNSFSSDEVYADANTTETAPSKPLIFTISNANTTAVTDLDIFDAFNNNITGADPHTLTSGVTISYDIPGYTYAQFLASLRTVPYQIGKILAISDDATTLRTPLTVKGYNIQGDYFGSPIIMNKSSFQQATDQIEQLVSFPLTGSTIMTIGQISAGKSITYQLFPTVAGSTVTPLNNGKNFQAPQLSGMPISTTSSVVKI